MKTKVLLFLQFLDKTLNDLRPCNILVYTPKMSRQISVGKNWNTLY